MGTPPTESAEASPVGAPLRRPCCRACIVDWVPLEVWLRECSIVCRRLPAVWLGSPGWVRAR
eukprot:2241808-Amphidinium_carterae.1